MLLFYLVQCLLFYLICSILEIVEALADILVLIAQEMGRVLLQLLPPRLHELAYQIGHFIENSGDYLRQFIDQVVVPVANFHTVNCQAVFFSQISFFRY